MLIRAKTCSISWSSRPRHKPFRGFTRYVDPLPYSLIPNPLTLCTTNTPDSIPIAHLCSTSWPSHQQDHHEMACNWYKSAYPFPSYHSTCSESLVHLNVLSLSSHSSTMAQSNTLHHGPPLQHVSLLLSQLLTVPLAPCPLAFSRHAPCASPCHAHSCHDWILLPMGP